MSYFLARHELPVGRQFHNLTGLILKVCKGTIFQGKSQVKRIT